MKQKQLARREQSTSDSERKIARSGPGRLTWFPGMPHPLDIMFEEAAQMREAILQELARLTQTIAGLEQLPEPEGTLTDADIAAQGVIWERYGSKKHYEHLQAVLATIRRRRVLARVEAAQAALDLAADLLSQEETLAQELLTSLEAGQQGHIASQRRRRSTDRERLPSYVGSPQAPLARLTRLDQRLDTIREVLTSGNGWFERFMVYKKHMKPEVRKLQRAFAKERSKGTPVDLELLLPVHPEVTRSLREGQKIPRELEEEAYYFTPHGPYLKYRWKEGNSPHLYTVALGKFAFGPGDTEFTPLP